MRFWRIINVFYHFFINVSNRPAAELPPSNFHSLESGIANAISSFKRRKMLISMTQNISYIKHGFDHDCSCRPIYFLFLQAQASETVINLCVVEEVAD